VDLELTTNEDYGVDDGVARERSESAERALEGIV
jgi:hypothetical protein